MTESTHIIFSHCANYVCTYQDFIRSVCVDFKY